MSAGTGGKALTVVFVSVLSWYSGMKFWKPILIERMKEDGTLRTDIEIDYDENDQPSSWQDLKDKVKTTLHPSLKEQVEEQRNLRDNLRKIENVEVENEIAKGK